MRSVVVLRDRTVNRLDRLMDGPWINRGCIAVIVIASLYFGLGVLAAVVR
jgi:hypothetical protein